MDDCSAVYVQLDIFYPSPMVQADTLAHGCLPVSSFHPNPRSLVHIPLCPLAHDVEFPPE